MPRNSNGTYTLPAGNPVVSGEVISTSWANPTMEDIANEITNSLDRSGRGGMQAPFKNFDGTQSAPGITWGNEPTTGFWRNAAQDMRVAVGGQPRERWTAAGVDIWNGTIWSPVVTNSTLETNLTAKGYAVKANNETISGAWTFSNSGTQTIAGYLKVGNGTASPGGRLLINSLSTEAAMIQLFKDTVASWLIGPPAASGDFVFTESGVERFRISNSGASVPGSFSAGSLGVAGNGTFGGTLGVTGHTTLASGQATSFSIITPNAAQLVFTPGSGNQAQLIYPSGSTFVIRDELSERLSIAAGAVSIPGSLNVTGALSQNAVAVALSTTTITGANTVTGGGSLAANRTLQLVNDVAAPGSSWYYGTDAAGTKGWFPLSGVVGVPEAPVDGNAYARQNASWVNIGTGGVYVLKTGDTMSGPLKISHIYPSYEFNETDGPPDQKNWSWLVDGGGMSLRLYTDDLSVYDQAITIYRSGHVSSNVQLKGSSSVQALAPTFLVSYAGNSYAESTGATRWIGVVAEAGNTGEVGVYANDGTNNPRTALFAHPTAIGIDWTYSNGISNFQFRRTGVTIFNYDQYGVNVINGLDLKHYGADNTTVMVQKVDSGGAAYWNTSGVTAYQWYLGGGYIAGLTEGQYIIQRNNGGDFSRLKLITNTANVSSTDGTTVDFLEGNTIVGYLRCLRDGTGGMTLMNASSGPLRFGANGVDVMQIVTGALNILAGKNLEVYAPNNTYNVTIKHDGTYGIFSTPADGAPMRFLIGAGERLRVATDAVSVWDYAAFRLYNSGNTAYTELQFTSDNGGTNQMRVASRGAAWHWNSNALVAGDVTIQTTDPATTGGRFGQIVLVYE